MLALPDNPLLQVNLSTQILCYILVTLPVVLRLVIWRELGRPFGAEDGIYSANIPQLNLILTYASDLLCCLGMKHY